MRNVRASLIAVTDECDEAVAYVTNALRAHPEERPEVLLRLKAELFKVQTSLYMAQAHRAVVLETLKEVAP